MVIEQDGCQRRDIDTELLRFGDLRGELRVQGVDALDDENVVGLHAQLLAALLAASRLEVIFRQLYLLATEERVELVVDELEIEGIDALVVIFALVVLGRVLTVDKIVVERNLQRFDAVGQQVYAQTLAGGGLSGGRRTGEEHEFHVLAAGNLVGDLGELLLLQGL